MAVALPRAEPSRFESLVDRLFPSRNDASIRRIFMFLAENIGSTFSNTEIEQAVGLSHGIVVRQTNRLFSILSGPSEHGVHVVRGGSGHQGYTYSLCEGRVSLAPVVSPTSDLGSLLPRITSQRARVLEVLSTLDLQEYSVADIEALLTDESIDTSAVLYALSLHSSRYRAFCDFLVRKKRAMAGVREQIYSLVGLDEGVAQAINHDFKGARRRAKRLVLRFLGHCPGRYFTIEQIMEGTRLTYNDIHQMLGSFVKLSTIPEYSEAYGFQVVVEDRNRPVTGGHGIQYALQLVGERPIKVRQNQTLTTPPRTQRHVPFDPSVGAAAAKEADCPIREDIPENAESIIRRASFVLREEKGELDIAFALLQARREGKACGMWPFKIQLDTKDNYQLGTEIEKRTLNYAIELGFVIFGDGKGHFSIFFLDEDERMDRLDDFYPGDACIQYTCDVRPFDYERLMKRIAPMLTDYRRRGRYGGGYDLPNDVYPPWMPSKLHYNLLQLVGRAHRDVLNPEHSRDTFFTLEEAAVFLNSRLPRPISIRRAKERVLVMFDEIYQHHELLRFFISRRKTQTPTFQIVLMDGDRCGASEVDDIPDVAGFAPPPGNQADFSPFLPGQV